MENQDMQEQTAVIAANENDLAEIVPTRNDAPFVQASSSSWFMQRKPQLITLGVFIMLAFISIFLLGNIFSSPETYAGITATLDEKKANVMALMTTTTAASAAVSLIPGEAGQPIADKLIDLSSYFMVILAVIYLEKFLIAVLGTLTFQIIIPVALVFLAIALFTPQGSLTTENLRKIGIKLGAFALAIFLVVPTSVWVSDKIDESFEVSLATANTSMQESTEQIEESIQEAEGEQEEKGLLESITDTVAGGFNAITGTVQNALDAFANQLNQLIDTLAVMIVTSCLIPIIVLALFLWAIKMLTGLNFGTTSTIMNAASRKGRSLATDIKSTFAKE